MSPALGFTSYVANDPVNLVDPSGTDIVVTGERLPCLNPKTTHDFYNCGYTWRLDYDRGGRTGGGGGFGSVPERVTVDKSCRNIPAAQDRNVQRAALAALREAIRAGAEQGFFVNRSLLNPSNYLVGGLFTSGHPREISRRVVDRNLPSFWGAVQCGIYPTPSLFVHTHQNNPPPSPIGPGDQASANRRGFPYAAIDRAGNLTCSGDPK